LEVVLLFSGPNYISYFSMFSITGPCPLFISNLVTLPFKECHHEILPSSENGEIPRLVGCRSEDLILKTTGGMEYEQCNHISVPEIPPWLKDSR
jgi:hypothetical protein